MRCSGNYPESLQRALDILGDMGLVLQMQAAQMQAAAGAGKG